MAKFYHENVVQCSNISSRKPVRQKSYQQYNKNTLHILGSGFCILSPIASVTFGEQTPYINRRHYETEIRVQGRAFGSLLHNTHFCCSVVSGSVTQTEYILQSEPLPIASQPCAETFSSVFCPAVYGKACISRRFV